MPNPATVDDIEARWRPLSDQERTNAQAFLEDAWWLILGRRPSLEADMTAGTVAMGNAVRVVSAVVLRLLRNPEGLASESIDDYTYRRDSLTSSGALHITPDELADITPGRAVKRSVRLVVHGDK
jgi:Phage protein Gp19/Gp15/Gp42